MIVLTSATLNTRLHFRRGCALTAALFPRAMLTSLDTSNLSTIQSPSCLPCPDSAYSAKPFLLPMPAHDLHSATLVISLFQKKNMPFSQSCFKGSKLVFRLPSFHYCVSGFLFLCATAETDVIRNTWRFAVLPCEVIMAIPKTQCQLSAHLRPLSQAQQTRCQH